MKYVMYMIRYVLFYCLGPIQEGHVYDTSQFSHIK
jgi:hypothetical protein